MANWQPIKVQVGVAWMPGAVDMEAVVAATEDDKGFVRLQLIGGGSIDAQGTLSDFIEFSGDDIRVTHIE
jgi:hypothetical protein